MKRVLMRCAVLIVTTLVSSPLLAAGHDLTPAPPAVNQMMPLVKGNGSGFLAAWSEWTTQVRHSVVSQVVNVAGRPAGARATVSQRGISSLAMARSSSDALLVVTDGNVSAERLSPSGFPMNTVLLDAGADYPSGGAVAWNGSRYFVVWAVGPQLIGAFVAPDGSTTTPKPFLTLPTDPAREVSLPDIAWDGQHFIVVFTGRPYPYCYTECGTPDPDEFGVLRVSSDGNAIEPPTYVKGSYMQAHVASSGADSLITLDSVGDVWSYSLHTSGTVSAIAMHDDGGVKLDAEKPMFQWRSDMSSAVAWNGLTYTVVWRYIDGDVTGRSGPSWLGAAEVTQSGVPFDYRFTATGDWLPLGVRWGQPSIAVDDAGVTAIALSEATRESAIARARLYFASELAPMPPPPTAPRSVAGFFDGRIARIDWQGETAVQFVIEYSSDSGKNWSLGAVVAGDLRTANVHALIGNQVRVRAVGPAGVSEGVVTTIVSMPRRRAARP
ncbi:MAG TPA: hypothetical protein VGQ65_01830 [Thermoanaerobaculia bacterium]|jgi:hypothetical protein|nr:hypothetical protein [Thermoanaerobaculia bacterium]